MRRWPTARSETTRWLRKRCRSGRRRFMTATFSKMSGETSSSAVGPTGRDVRDATVPEGLFTPMWSLNLNVPHGRQTFRGLDAVRSGVSAGISPGRVEEEWFLPAIGGFVVEIALRSAGYSRQVCVARTQGGLIADLSIYCTGDFAEVTPSCAGSTARRNVVSLPGRVGNLAFLLSAVCGCVRV